MIPHSRARDNLAEILSVDRKKSALGSIGINDAGNPIRFRIVRRTLTSNDQSQKIEHRLECIERGSTVDELLKFLGPFCPDITANVQKSTGFMDVYEPLVIALMNDIDFDAKDVTKILGCTFDDFSIETRDINDMRAMRPKKETLRRIGSITFQYTIVSCKQKSWIAIEKLQRIDSLCQSVSLPVVFELFDSRGFHDRFSMFPGIMAETDNAVFIVELEDAIKSHQRESCECGAERNPCRKNILSLSDVFIDVSKLTIDDSGNVMFGGKRVNFVFA